MTTGHSGRPSWKQSISRTLHTADRVVRILGHTAFFPICIYLVMAMLSPQRRALIIEYVRHQRQSMSGSEFAILVALTIIGFVSLAGDVLGFTTHRPHRPRGPNLTQIESPPLMTIDVILRFFCSAKTYEHVFRPARADLVDEWQQAHIAGEVRRAWYVKYFLAYWIILSHIASQLPTSVAKIVSRFFEVSK